MTQDKTVSPTSVATTPRTFERTPELEQWLDAAIQAKVDEGGLTFGDPQNNPEQTNAQKEDPNPSINLGRFGFKNPNDLKAFLLTPAGDTVKADIGAQIELDETIKKQQEFYSREEEETKHRLKAMLFLYLIEKESHAAKQLQELVTEQNEKAIKQSAPDPKVAQKALAEQKADPGLQQTLANYETAIKSHKEQHQNLVQEEKKLIEQSEKLEKQTTQMNSKYKTYNDSLEEIDKSAADYEKLSNKELDSEIQKLETEVIAQTDKIADLMDNDREDEARVLLDKQNALNLKLISLNDIRSERANALKFYDANGKDSDKNGNKISANDAAYAVPNKDKQIFERNNTLHRAGANESNLTEVQKIEREIKFLKAMNGFLSVKGAVENAQKEEMKFLNGRVSDTRAKLDANKTEQSLIQNQIRLLESSRAAAQAAAQQQSPGAGPSGAPTPSPSMSAPSSSKSSPKISAAVSTFIDDNHKACFDGKMTPNSLSDLLNKKGPRNEQEKAEMQKFLASQLQGIPSTAPIPFQTMQGLLKNMARFGADPNKPGLTAIPDPLDMQQGQSKINNLSDNDPQREASISPTIESEPQLTAKEEPGAEEEESPDINPARAHI
ncbi:MAG: hypothetical protein P4L65_08595 [Legionella sp.]|nr:hypothetical protein [Legionella sp.]